MTTFKHTALIAHPRTAVARWYGRPGAVVRLSPPWNSTVLTEPTQGLDVGSETELLMGTPWADDLLKGRVPVRLGKKWRAEHTEHVPGASFTDVMKSGPLKSWTHRHEFDDAHDHQTLVTDTVDYELPGSLERRVKIGATAFEQELSRVFAYRTAQTQADLDFGERLDALVARSGSASGKLKVAIAGASGLVGSQVSALLRAAGHEVVHLRRRQGYTGTIGDNDVAWDPTQRLLDPRKLVGLDAVINLAGAGIAGAFTRRHRRDVLESRLNSTETIVAAMREAAGIGGPKVLINASASGYYGHEAGFVTEDDGPGDDFLASVCSQWEAAALKAEEFGARVVLVRTGLVLGSAGGLLGAQLPLYLAGAGGPMGGGDQWQPWIGLDDMAQIYAFAVADSALSGPVNAAAPTPVRQKEFAKTLAAVLRRPGIVPTPKAAPSLLLGRRGAQELALSSVAMAPDALESAEYPFRFTDLESALRHTLGRTVA